MMSSPYSLAALIALLLALPAGAGSVVETDVCVYGGTSGGVIAAVQASRQGKAVALAVFNNHVGGMTSGGLGATDVGNKGDGYIQGLTRNFYERVGAKYGTGAKISGFEPHVAETVFNEMLTEAGVTTRYNQRLASATKAGQRITQITMEDGTVYRAQMFIDATYEGDLMAMAGVTWTIGRESTATYGESLNGIRANTPQHQFNVNVDPYIVSGNPASGLLPFIQNGNGGTAGDGDPRVQAYNYRLCLTNNSANRNPITAPAGYSESQYELLGRLIDARIANNETLTLGSFMNVSGMSGSKTDINNNGAFSTDFIGMADSYATATYAQRATLEKQHRDYIQGFLYYLGHGTRVPSSVQTAMLNYGWCKDEFTDTGGWPHQLYVREARRMVSDYVMLQQNCLGSRVASDPVGLGAYTMDSHNCQRVVQNGVVKNEGDVQSTVPAFYGISYRSIVPKAGECENLLVPWALSASHMAFGSIRMEPVFMILGQSAATAAAFAIDDNAAVQAVSYPKLALQLTADKQLISTTSASEIIVDNADPTGVTVTGAWTASTSTQGFIGSNYLHDGNAGKGSKNVRFTPNLPAGGQYDVYLRWTADPNRAKNAPVDVISATGTTTYTVDQTLNGGSWRLLGRAQFDAGTTGSVLVRTDGTLIDSTHGFVIVDAARWVPVTSGVTVQIVATDAFTREGAPDAAKLTLVRTGDTTNPLTVNYTTGGTAQPDDYAALPGTVTFAAGATTAVITVQASGDSVAEGLESLTVTLQPGTGYTVGAQFSATAFLIDKPIDDWKHSQFSTSELADPAISGDAADPDLDGWTNLEEYALGLNPHQADTPDLGLQTGPGGLTLSYSRTKASTDAAVTAEGSYDLSTWGTSGVVEEVSRVDAGSSERVAVRLLPSAGSPGRGFLRLKITR